jgi:hypothetical protein
MCRVGSWNHIHHYQPNKGDLAVLKRHISIATCKLISDGFDACTGSSSVHFLVLWNQDMFVNKSTLRSIRISPQFLSSSHADNVGGKSTTSHIVNWLREKSTDEEISLRYTVLFHRLLGGDTFHKHPKGRPGSDYLPLAVVNRNMQSSPSLRMSTITVIFLKHGMGRKMMRKKHQANQLFQQMEYMERIS